MKTVSVERLSQQFVPEYFRGLSTFGAMSDETVLRLLKQGKIIHLTPGEKLYCAGRKVGEFYVVLSGKISMFRNYETKPALTRRYGPGEEAGFAAMIGLHDRYATAVAEEVSFVLEVSADQFFELHLTAPQDFGVLMLNLAREMSRTIGHMGDQITLLRAQCPPSDEH